MADSYCPDCKRLTETVFDHAAGDTICSGCGLVLEAHSVDETSEWRTFANESSDHDPNRVGGPLNPLLADGGLTTVISKTNGSSKSNDLLSGSIGKWWQNRGANPDRSLLQAFKPIDYLRRFCSNLGMTNQAVKAAQEAVQKSEELDVRRSPISVAAVFIYILTQLTDDNKPLKDISVVTQVAEGTIKNAYKDLCPHLSQIVPSWFAKEEDVKNLQPRDLLKSEEESDGCTFCYRTEFAGVSK